MARAILDAVIFLLVIGTIAYGLHSWLRSPDFSNEQIVDFGTYATPHQDCRDDLPGYQQCGDHSCGCWEPNAPR